MKVKIFLMISPGNETGYNLTTYAEDEYGFDFLQDSSDYLLIKEVDIDLSLHADWISSQGVENCERGIERAQQKAHEEIERMKDYMTKYQTLPKPGELS